MSRKKIVLLLVGVATTTLMGVAVHVRADKSNQSTAKSNSRASSRNKTAVTPIKAKAKVMTKTNTVKAETPQTSVAPVKTVAWQENFASYTTNVPNPAYWNTAGANQPIYNEEAQKYDASTQSVRIEGGNLVIEARKTPTGYTSGMVDTKGKVKITQGSRLEARIKLPKGRGVWPAFWLLSDNQPYTSALNPTATDWDSERFYMHDGEVDIMESYGTYPGVVEATLHTFAQSTERSVSSIDNNFHTYWMEWTEEKLVMGVDDKVISSIPANPDPTKWPLTSSNQMYVILNLALGGTGGGQIIPAVGDNWQMHVASINYQRL